MQSRVKSDEMRHPAVKTAPFQASLYSPRWNAASSPWCICLFLWWHGPLWKARAVRECGEIRELKVTPWLRTLHWLRTARFILRLPWQCGFLALINYITFKKEKKKSPPSSIQETMQTIDFTHSISSHFILRCSAYMKISYVIKHIFP